MSIEVFIIITSNTDAFTFGISNESIYICKLFSLHCISGCYWLMADSDTNDRTGLFIQAYVHILFAKRPSNQKLTAYCVVIYYCRSSIDDDDSKSGHNLDEH